MLLALFLTYDTLYSMNEEAKTSHEIVEELVFENKNINALIKGVEDDIETLKNENTAGTKAADIVRFNIELNILRDKRERNLRAINRMIESKII